MSFLYTLTLEWLGFSFKSSISSQTIYILTRPFFIELNPSFNCLSNQIWSLLIDISKNLVYNEKQKWKKSNLKQTFEKLTLFISSKFKHWLTRASDDYESWVMTQQSNMTKSVGPKAMKMWPTESRWPTTSSVQHFLPTSTPQFYLIQYPSPRNISII